MTNSYIYDNDNDVKASKIFIEKIGENNPFGAVLNIENYFSSFLTSDNENKNNTMKGYFLFVISNYSIIMLLISILRSIFTVPGQIPQVIFI